MVEENKKIQLEKDERKDFEDLLLTHLDSIYNAALRLSPSPSDAEDLVQETFYRAFRFFDQCKEDSNFKAWLFQILRNTYFNLYRKSQKKIETVDIDNIDDISDEEAHSPLVRVTPDRKKKSMKTAFHDEVTTALDKLPAEHKLCIILKDIEGFSYQEISEITGDPVGTIMSRLHRARKMLQSYLTDYAKKRGYDVDEDEIGDSSLSVNDERDPNEKGAHST